MIFLTGPHGSGKTTIAKELIKQGFFYIETGEIVRKEYKKRAPNIDFSLWAVSQKHSFDHLIEEAAKKIQAKINESDAFQDILIVGNRQITGIDYLTQRIPQSKKNLIIYIDANEKILFERCMKREGKKIEQECFKEFQEEKINFDKKMGLENIKKRADLILINEGNLCDCVNAVRDFLISKKYLS